MQKNKKLNTISIKEFERRRDAGIIIPINDNRYDNGDFEVCDFWRDKETGKNYEVKYDIRIIEITET